jgi:hypothetical protein
MAGDFTLGEIDALLIAVFHLLATMKAETDEPAEIYHDVLQKLITLRKRSMAQ